MPLGSRDGTHFGALTSRGTVGSTVPGSVVPGSLVPGPGVCGCCWAGGIPNGSAWRRSMVSQSGASEPSNWSATAVSAPPPHSTWSSKPSTESNVSAPGVPNEPIWSTPEKLLSPSSVSVPGPPVILSPPLPPASTFERALPISTSGPDDPRNSPAFSTESSESLPAGYPPNAPNEYSPRSRSMVENGVSPPFPNVTYWIVSLPSPPRSTSPTPSALLAKNVSRPAPRSIVSPSPRSNAVRSSPGPPFTTSPPAPPSR